MLTVLCKICNAKKENTYCYNCGAETPTFFGKELIEKVALTDSLRNLSKSLQRINGKPLREIEQYIGNRDGNVISEYERWRTKSEPTQVIHRLWRRIGNVFRKVHEHQK